MGLRGQPRLFRGVQRLTVTDKSRSSGSERTVPQTPDSLLFDPIAKQLETSFRAIGLLRSLQCIDWRQYHTEARRGDRSCDGLDQYRPGQGRK